MLRAAALAALLRGAAAAGAPRAAARDVASPGAVVDLCPPFSMSAGGTAPGGAAAGRLAAMGARLPARKHVHPPRPEGGDVERTTWQGCAALSSAERVRPEAEPPAPAWPWDSFGAGSSGGALGLRPAELEYHGGAVLTGADVSTPDESQAASSAQRATPVHLIWYGSWNASDAARRLLPLAVTGASDSPWMRINAAYYSLPTDTGDANATALAPARRYASTSMRLAESVAVTGFPYGAALSDEDVAALVADAIETGLPLSSDAIYVVLTSADVGLTSGFCRDYCGWHASAELLGKFVRFALVGDPSGCARPATCTPLSAATAPNGALGADAMASVLLHELAEVITDPDLESWYDRDGLENADKCAWRFGAGQTVGPDGRVHNVVLSGERFLIQQNWVLPADGATTGGYCAMQAAPL